MLTILSVLNGAHEFIAKFVENEINKLSVSLSYVPTTFFSFMFELLVVERVCIY